MSQTMEKRTERRVERISVTISTAAAMLDLHYQTIRKLMREGVFTTIATPKGRGRGKRVYVFVDEIKCYGETRDPAAVLELRARKGRLPKGRRS